MRISLAIILSCCLLTACQSRPVELHFSGPTMGTFYSIKVIAPKNAANQLEVNLVKDIPQHLNDLNQIFSTYCQDSELSAFNQLRSLEPVKASPMLLEVLEKAQQVSELSGGAFDVTVGPLVNLYGFGPPARSLEAPTAAEIAGVRDQVGYKLLDVNAETGTIAKKHPGVYVDLSAIAKGYAVDAISELLERHQVGSYLVEIGGEVRVRGLNRKGLPWAIGIELPLDLKRELRSAIELSDQAIATSGDYRNFVILNGKRLSHTIDPRSGTTVEHGLASVSVIAERCMDADAYATAITVLGPEAGLKLAEAARLAALLIVRAKDGSFSSRKTKLFPKEIRLE